MPLLGFGVLATLAGLAADDEHHARLRETLLVFLHTGGSYKATAEQLTLHKNTVQYRIRKAEMTSARRAREVARPRQVAMYLSKQLTPRSLPEIGRRFGGRDHTTVIHAVRQIEKLRASDAELDADIRRHGLVLPVWRLHRHLGMGGGNLSQ